VCIIYWLPQALRGLTSTEFILACALRMGIPIPWVAQRAIGPSAAQQSIATTIECDRACIGKGVLWSESCIHGLCCSLNQAYTHRHDNLRDYILEQCKRSSLETTTLTAECEAKIFATHATGDRQGMRSQQRMDIVIHRWTWELHKRADLPIPEEFQGAEGDVILLVDVFFSDILAYLHEASFAKIANDADLKKLSSASPLCDPNFVCMRRAAASKHKKYDANIKLMNANRPPGSPPYVLLPLNLDVLGYASKDTKSFLNALFRLEVHRKHHILSLQASQLDENDDSGSNSALHQSLLDNTLSKRWREVSTLINRSTAAHIIRNADSVSVSCAKNAANTLRFMPRVSSVTTAATTITINDTVDSVDDDVDSVLDNGNDNDDDDDDDDVDNGGSTVHHGTHVNNIPASDNSHNAPAENEIGNAYTELSDDDDDDDIGESQRGTHGMSAIFGYFNFYNPLKGVIGFK
jgi:hypothetical protein